MIIDVLTLFPQFYESAISVGIVNRAIKEGKINLNIVNIRDFGEGNYKRCDDYPYGGGPGMILTYGIFKKYFEGGERGHTIIFSPSGKTLNQKKIKELSSKERLTMILGRYEGIDCRVEKKYADESLSVGDYVLSGGEIPALLTIEAISRYKGILNNEESVYEDTFEENLTGLLEYEQYTRPSEIDGMQVPSELLSGNFKNIEEYRRASSLIKTFKNRADMFSKIELSKKDLKVIFDYLINNRS